MIIEVYDSPKRLRKYTDNNILVSFPINIILNSQGVTKPDLYAIIHVFINKWVITKAPYRPRRLRKHTDNHKVVCFPLNVFLNVKVLQKLFYMCIYYQTSDY